MMMVTVLDVATTANPAKANMKHFWIENLNVILRHVIGALARVTAMLIIKSVRLA